MYVTGVYIFSTAIGFNVETVQYNNIKFQVWDLGMLIQTYILKWFIEFVCM